MARQMPVKYERRGIRSKPAIRDMRSIPAGWRALLGSHADSHAALLAARYELTSQDPRNASRRESQSISCRAMNEGAISAGAGQVLRHLPSAAKMSFQKELYFKAASIATTPAKSYKPPPAPSRRRWPAAGRPST